MIVLTQELARSGNAHLGQVKQEFARELETPVDLVSAVHVGSASMSASPCRVGIAHVDQTLSSRQLSGSG